MSAAHRTGHVIFKQKTSSPAPDNSINYGYLARHKCNKLKQKDNDTKKIHCKEKNIISHKVQHRLLNLNFFKIQIQGHK